MIGFFCLTLQRKVGKNGKLVDLETKEEFPFWKTFAREKTNKFTVLDNYDDHKQKKKTL